jgi:hypothetical protein
MLFHPQILKSSIPAHWDSSSSTFTFPHFHTSSLLFTPSLPVLLQDLFYPTHLSGIQHDFDAVRVLTRFGEDSLDEAFGKLTAPLVVFLHDGHFLANFDVFSLVSVWHASRLAFVYQLKMERLSSKKSKCYDHLKES